MLTTKSSEHSQQLIRFAGINDNQRITLKKKKTKQFSARKSSHKSAFSLLASEKKTCLGQIISVFFALMGKEPTIFFLWAASSQGIHCPAWKSPFPKPSLELLHLPFSSRIHPSGAGMLVPSQEYEGKKNILKWYHYGLTMNFWLLLPKSFLIPLNFEAVRILQMVCRDRTFITNLKNNGIKQLEFSQRLKKLLPGLFIYFLNLSRAFIERQQIWTLPSATKGEGKVRTCQEQENARNPGFFSHREMFVLGV